MDNRLQINPLLEENMLQMVDGEFAISQITGHVNIKKGDEYVSKTKKINCELIDSNYKKQTLVGQLEHDENILNNRKNTTSRLEAMNETILNKLNEIDTLLTRYEKICADTEIRLLNDDKRVLDTLKTAQKNINVEINSNIKLLGDLMIQYELLDRISDNETYFNNYVKNKFKYPDSNDNIQDYGTISQHADNKVEMTKRVNKSVYDAYCRDLEGRYRAEGASYKITGGY